MKIELDAQQLDEVARKEIEALRKEVARLERQVKSRDKSLQRLQTGMDVSKERREHIRGLAESLKNELQDAGWADYDECGL